MYNAAKVKYAGKNMPKKPITWIGSMAILAVGIFAFWSLSRSISHFLPDSTGFHLATVGTFLAPLITLIAISLWYYLNEKQ